MPWPRRIGLALLSLTVPPSTTPEDGPLPAGATAVAGPLAPSWTKKHAEVHAMRVRLNRLGVRSHQNWIFFRLPFAVTQQGRVRSVRFFADVSAPTDVGAFRLGSVCVEVPSRGGIDAWTLFTANGIGGTIPFRDHGMPPTDDPTVAALNVPTRVANYVACGWDEGRLRDGATWTLAIEWEER